MTGKKRGHKHASQLDKPLIMATGDAHVCHSNV